jgi:hypothetical protein
VEADWGVQGCATGGEGVAANPAEAGGVRRGLYEWGGWESGNERRVEA